MRITAQRSGLGFQFFKHDHVCTGRIISSELQISENEVVTARRMQMLVVKRPASFWDWLKFRLSNAQK